MLNRSIAFFIAALSTVSSPATFASQNILYQPHEDAALTINLIGNTHTESKTVDQHPAYTVLADINKIVRKTPTLTNEFSTSAQISTRVASNLNAVNYPEKKLLFTVRAITEMSCTGINNATIETIQSVTVKPTQYEIRSVDMNDIREIWKNASLALAYKTVTSEKFKLGLANCGIQLDIRNLKGDLHHLSRM